MKREPEREREEKVLFLGWLLVWSNKALNGQLFSSAFAVVRDKSDKPEKNCNILRNRKILRSFISLLDRKYFQQSLKILKDTTQFNSCWTYRPSSKWRNYRKKSKLTGSTLH